MDQMTNRTKQLSRSQLVLALSAILVFALLYFGLDTRPSGQEKVEKSRALASTATDFSTILENARSELGENSLLQLSQLDVRLETAENDSTRTELLKQLSGEWFRLGYPEVAGHYAEKVAEKENSAQAWSIAGTTYNYGIRGEKNERVRSYCFDRAVLAFESALSLDPDETQHKLNLALTYVAKPPQDNPMKGILMLRRLNEEKPENVSVLNQLGRLALTTGQTDKALERLEKAISLEPDNLQSNCLLANAYEQANRPEEAEKYAAKCNELRSK
jgi:tetratricopeptide (TPR) repeat protein